MNAHVNAITLGVRDINRAKKFYSEGLGWPMEQDYCEFVSFRPAEGSSTVTLSYLVRSEDRANAVLVEAERAGGPIVKRAQQARVDTSATSPIRTAISGRSRLGPERNRSPNRRALVLPSTRRILRWVDDLAGAVDRIASETTFSGAVRVDRGEDVLLAKAFGYADRRHRIGNTVDTQFAIASGTKGMTALAVVSLIEEGRLGWTTSARSVLGPDLPLINDAVTVEHLLAHRSGIGDYLDESGDHPITDYALPVPVHELETTEQYLAVLDGKPTEFQPGERFSYCDSGYVVLALIAERTSGIPFHDLIRQRVCEPAGMHDTEFLRSDELSGRAALGYLSIGDERTNVFHLPVRGSGDGGIYSTVADVHALWRALFDGGIVSPATVTEMVRPRSEVPSSSMRYGLGFWLLEPGSAVMLEGYDAGVSFRSVHDPASGTTYTVVANTSEGAWPLVRHLEESLVRTAR